MSKHPTPLPCWGGGDNLGPIAVQIADLRYDKVSSFLSSLSQCFARDAAKNNQKLAAALQSLADRLELATISADIVWGICKEVKNG